MIDYADLGRDIREITWRRLRVTMADGKASIRDISHCSDLRHRPPTVFLAINHVYRRPKLGDSPRRLRDNVRYAVPP